MIFDGVKKFGMLPGWRWYATAAGLLFVLLLAARPPDLVTMQP